MQRAIYIVEAKIVDANGTLGNATGYPKTFDSNNYEGDTVKAERRAKAAYHSALASMYAVDGRQLQSAYIAMPDGNVRWSECDGQLAEVEPPVTEVEPPVEGEGE